MQSRLADLKPILVECCLPWLTCRNLLAAYVLVMMPVIALVNYGGAMSGASTDHFLPSQQSRAGQNAANEDVWDTVSSGWERQLENLRQETEKLGQQVAELNNDNGHQKLLKNINDIRSPFRCLYEKLNRDLVLIMRDPVKEFQEMGKRKADYNVIEENVRLLKHQTEKLKSHHNKYRSRAYGKLSEDVQRKIFLHQHPKNCNATQKLVCVLNKDCGLGCQLHHVALCLIASLALNRTMILRSNPWKYSPNFGRFFRPVTSCVEDPTITEPLPVFVNERESQHHPSFVYPFFPEPTPTWIPFAVPHDVLQRASVLHEQPSLFWIGQGLTYLWRLQPNITRKFEKEAAKLGFRTPVVGIHVRRTDKLLKEARLHSIQSYLKPAEDYWLQRSFRQPNSVPRNLFVASDDARVLRDIQRKYSKHINILGKSNETRSSASLQSRYSEKSLLELLRDIYFLSKSDFLVCTFSSLICKLAYELKQFREDATGSFTSLDDSYWFPGSQAHVTVALRDHIPQNNLSDGNASRNQIAIQKGDRVNGVFNLWDGFSIGVNTRTNEKVTMGINQRVYVLASSAVVTSVLFVVGPRNGAIPLPDTPALESWHRAVALGSGALALGYLAYSAVDHVKTVIPKFQM
ncbi:Alpha-(1,6)-fucosyltransferase [Hypsibius exemplaris]|uniref:Alpha-(1,6)-fucosyltransferase n=1 Tax=Hypsibius exemplaris TaxID=2072580 RepID=A0A1W0XB00_HYPEX|nr:Alpha-(1,6)-fucosyltransferase [Hypsibius exemplaris]